MAGTFTGGDVNTDIVWAIPAAKTVNGVTKSGFKWEFSTGSATTSPGSFSTNTMIAGTSTDPDFLITGLNNQTAKPLVGDFDGAPIPATPVTSPKYTDIAIYNPPTSKLYIRKNLGNGTFATETTGNLTVTGIRTNVATGDFNGDGKTDLLSWNNDGSYEFVLHIIDGNGNATNNPTFTQKIFSLPNMGGIGSGGIYPGDINGDGYADLIYTDRDGAHSLVNLYDQAQPQATSLLGQFGQPVAQAYHRQASYNLFVGDCNGDKLADIASIEDLNPTVLSGDVTAAIQIRYMVKGTAPRFLKNATNGTNGLCLTALTVPQTSNDTYTNLKGVANLTVKTCVPPSDTNLSNDPVTQSQLFQLGYHNSATTSKGAIGKIETFNGFQLYANGANTVIQQDINNLNAAPANTTDWEISYSYGEMTYFQIKSIGQAGKCLQAGNPVTLATCDSNALAQKWTHLLNP